MQIYLPQGKNEIQPEFLVSKEDSPSYSIPGELVAESWNEKSKVWSGIFKLDIRNLSAGDNSLEVKILAYGKDSVISREVELTLIH